MTDNNTCFGYGSGSLCGDCLHHKDAHELFNGWYRCAVCGKTCDPECYRKEHKAGNILVSQTNKVRYEAASKRPVSSAPAKITGQ